MAFGIICDRCGEICNFKKGESAYELRLYKASDIQHSSLTKSDVYLCYECKKKLDQFLNDIGDC